VQIQDGMGRKVGDLLQYLTQVVAALGVAFYLCWELTVVLLAAIPLIGLAGAYMIRSINAATHESFAQYAQAGAVAQESVSAMRTVSAFNLQPIFITKYRVFLLEAMRIGVDKGMHVGLGNGAVFGVAFLTYALGFWYGGKLVADDLANNCQEDCMTGGTILAVFFSTIMGSMALGQMAPPLTSFATAQASIAIIYDVLDRKPLIDGLSDEGVKIHRSENSNIKGEIDLKQVRFAYPSRPDITVCNDINLHINAGETVALVGASGCGKVMSVYHHHVSM
jgi:ATP-binding cassette, subfamily B (MDR/TAP), member 1